LDHVTESFRKLIRLIPPEGLLIANGDDPVVAAEIGRARCPVRTFSLSPKGHWRPEEIREQEGGTHLKVLRGEEEPLDLTTPLYGRHNISNLISAAAVAFHLGVPDPVLADAAQGFKGVARRQEVVGEKRGILVLDDFAHHPTAVRETLAAVRGRYPRRRLVAVFEPRSNSSSRRVFQGRYTRAFDSADLVLAREPSRAEKIPPGERFSSARLAEDLRARGLESASFGDTDLLLETLVHRVLEGDVILVMSNGPFDNLPLRLLEAL
jgi:UDP-N-acetylmuramate: L-alanyl-gamma-D-glutamyl-meso-diaminopimelate ligase